MKLIMEGASLLTGHFEDELNESTGGTERNYYISGTFSTPEAKNRNGRVYSRSIWEREVAKYQKEINEKTVNTLGEWQHPPRSTVDPIKAVLRIVELKMDATGNVVGKAKILNNNTEATNSIKGLIKEGIKIGVSSRGVGKVSATGIVEDFKLITYDAVDMPSDYNAMLDGVVEGVQFLNGIAQDKEYKVDENGCVGEVCSMTAPVQEAKDGEITVEKCPIQEKIDEAVTAAKEEIYANVDTYLKEAFSDNKDEMIKNISEFLNPAKAEEVVVEKKFKGEKEYIFKTRDDADAASNMLLNYSKEGWEIQGKIITVDVEDVAAELDDIIKDDKLQISKILEGEEAKEEKKDDSELANKLLEALSEKKDEEAKDGAKKDEDEDDSTEGKCSECGKDIEEEDAKLCQACTDKVEDEEKIEEKAIDRLVKMGILSQKEFDKAMNFVDKVDSYEDFKDAFPKMKTSAMTMFRDLFKD